jgi:hypothetical protein
MLHSMFKEIEGLLSKDGVPCISLVPSGDEVREEVQGAWCSHWNGIQQHQTTVLTNSCSKMAFAPCQTGINVLPLSVLLQVP